MLKINSLTLKLQTKTTTILKKAKTLLPILRSLTSVNLIQKSKALKMLQQHDHCTLHVKLRNPLQSLRRLTFCGVC